MENQYQESATIIKNYLEEKNLGNFEQELFENACVKFKEQFGIEILEKLDGVDLLNSRIFKYCTLLFKRVYNFWRYWWRIRI